MARTPFESMRRPAPLCFGLALFLVGIHWCLVGMLVPQAGAGMPCMPIAAEAAEGKSAHGGHCAGMAQQGDEGTPPAPAPPCCVALAPVLAPEAGTVALPLLAVLGRAGDAPRPADALREGERLRAPPESPPHLAARGAPSSPRAPPTA